MGSRRIASAVPLLLVATLLGWAPSCGGPNLAQRVAEPPTFAPRGQTKCASATSNTRPLIVEWPSPDRASLESQVRSGVLAVRYDGCEMEVLDRCRVHGASYAYTGVTPKGDRLSIKTADDLYAHLPMGAAQLEGKLQASGELNVDMTIVGTFEADRSAAGPGDLEGDCDGATHVVAALTVGAFDLFAGADADVGASVSAFGAGAGGESTAKHESLNRDGDGASCAKARTDDKRPPEGCGAVLRVEVVKLGEARARADADAGPTLLAVECPSGSARQGDKCVATQVVCPDSRAVYRDGQCVMPRLLRLAVPDDAPVRGSATAPVTVQAFLDLQCPFSARALTGAIGRAGGFAQAVLAHPDDVRVVFRHNPLPFHLGAEPASEAALEARAEKGDDAFWQMVLTLYGSQQSFFTRDGLDLSKLDALSTMVGVDVAKVRSAIAEHRYQARIAADQKVARDNGLSGTPTFVVGDEIVVGAQSGDVFTAAIARQKALAAHP